MSDSTATSIHAYTPAQLSQYLKSRIFPQFGDRAFAVLKPFEDLEIDGGTFLNFGEDIRVLAAAPQAVFWKSRQRCAAT